MNSIELAEILWKRVKDFIKPVEFLENDDPKHQHIHGIPFLLKGKWSPVGFNHVSFCPFPLIYEVPETSPL